MALTRRLCVTGLVIYAPGESINSHFGDNSLPWLFDSQEKSSVLRFWSDSSGDLVDLSADVFGWKFVESAELVQRMTTSPDRNVRLQAGCDVLLENGVPVGNYDVFVLVVGGRIIGGGAGGVRVNDRLIPSVLMDDDGWHNMFCHEVGHAIGFDHPYRPGFSTGPGLSHGEYGSPYCIMGFSDVTGTSHIVPFDPASTINPGVNLWTAGGPGVAAASLWRFLPGFPAIPPWAVKLDPGPAVRVSLDPPWRGSGKRLAVMPISGPGWGGDGWWTVEYRPAASWDRGAQAHDLDPARCPGIVIHRIRDVGFEGEPGFPLAQRVCYEATIPVPSGGDEDWDNGHFAVRVLEAGGSAQLLIGKTLPDARSVRMEIVESSGPERRDPFGNVELKLTGPACSTNSYPAEAVSANYVVELSAAATGYEEPAFKYAVNGADLGIVSAPNGPLQQGQVTFIASVQVPNGYRSYYLEERSVLATYNARGNRLGLTFAEPHGTYPVTITVHAVDLTGDEHRTSSSTTVTALTRWIDLSQAAKDAQQACANFLSHYVVIADPLRFDPIGPVAHVLHMPILVVEGTDVDPEALAATLYALRRLEAVSPILARQETTAVAARLGIDEAELRRVVQELPYS